MPDSNELQFTRTLRLVINGRESSVTCTPDGTLSVTALLHTLGVPSPHFAIAVNLCFVPHGQHDSTQLRHGDCVEIVAPMQGG